MAAANPSYVESFLGAFSGRRLYGFLRKTTKELIFARVFVLIFNGRIFGEAASIKTIFREI